MTTEAWIGLIGLAVSTLAASLALVYRQGKLTGCVDELKRRVIRLESCQETLEQSLGEIRESVARIEGLLTEKLK